MRRTSRSCRCRARRTSSRRRRRFVMSASRVTLASLCAIVLGSCASSTVFRDDKSAEGRGYFAVEKRENGSFFGNLSGYTANMDPRGGAVSQEFWDRARAFCRAEVERLTDGLCVVHARKDTPPGTELGQCKMDEFRSGTAA
jgi:hypothetical protein